MCHRLAVRTADCLSGVTTDARRMIDGGRKVMRTRGKHLVTRGHCRMNGKAVLRLGSSRITLARTRLACGRSVCSCLITGTSLSRMLKERRMARWLGARRLGFRCRGVFPVDDPTHHYTVKLIR